MNAAPALRTPAVDQQAGRPEWQGVGQPGVFDLVDEKGAVMARATRIMTGRRKGKYAVEAPGAGTRTLATLHDARMHAYRVRFASSVRSA